MDDAYLFAQRCELEALLVQVEGMKAENQHRLDCGNSIAYGEDAFFEKARAIVGIGEHVMRSR